MLSNLPYSYACPNPLPCRPELRVEGIATCQANHECLCYNSCNIAIWQAMNMQLIQLCVLYLAKPIENMGITEQEQKNSPTTTTANGKMDIDITKPEQELEQQSEKSPKKSPINETTIHGTLQQSKYNNYHNDK